MLDYIIRSLVRSLFYPPRRSRSWGTKISDYQKLARVISGPQRFDPQKQRAGKSVPLNITEIQSKVPNLPWIRIKWVVDGDTVIAEKGWSKITIRLDAIDCPEDDQPWGDTAKYGLIKLIGKQRVHYEDHGIDGYGRVLATFFVWNKAKGEWMNVNERMVTLGHAWVMKAYYNHLPKDRQNKLNKVEQWAKGKKVGLWKTEESNCSLGMAEVTK